MLNLPTFQQIRIRPHTALFSIFTLSLLVLLPFTAVADDTAKQQALVDNAKITVEKFLADSNMESFQKLAKEAKGLFIVPQILKGAFFFGGEGGSGVLLTRDEKTGEWSYPAFYTIGSASFGFQFGGKSSQVVMVVRTQKGLEEFYQTDFKIGAGANIAAGPIGRGAAAKGIAADLVAFAYSKGAFAGISLDGSGIKVSDGNNKSYYGKAVRPVDILVKNSVQNPKADALRSALPKMKE